MTKTILERKTMQFSDILAVVSLLVSLIAIALGTWIALRQHVVAGKDLTLTAYSHAIQAILGLKDMFREHSDIFEKQVSLGPEFQALIPHGMDTRTFLTFANAFWRLSYIYSVMVRWKELGLREEERQALEGEMRAWLLVSPGFRLVYEHFVVKVDNHNPKFKQWLKEVYSSDE